MADFFEDFGKKLSEVAADLGKKTEDTIEIQKLKGEIRSLNRGNQRDYIDMGKAIYEKFKNGEVTDTDSIVLCEAIEKREEQIADLEEKIEKIRTDV